MMGRGNGRATRGERCTDAFADWLRFAKPRDRVSYYRGFMALDKADDRSIIPFSLIVLEAQNAGLVTVVQKRHDHREYEYIAIRTTRSLSAFNDTDRDLVSDNGFEREAFDRRKRARRHLAQLLKAAE